MWKEESFLLFFFLSFFFEWNCGDAWKRFWSSAVAFSPLLRSKNLFARLEVGRWKIRLVRRNHSTQKAFEEVVDEIWTTGMNIARGSRSGSGYSFLARLVSPTAPPCRRVQKYGDLFKIREEHHSKLKNSGERSETYASLPHVFHHAGRDTRRIRFSLSLFLSPSEDLSGLSSHGTANSARTTSVLTLFHVYTFL